MGNKESLEIDEDESDLERIETLVQNGTLRIRLKRDAKNYNIPFKKKVNIYITAKKLDALAVSGSGSLEVKRNDGFGECKSSIKWFRKYYCAS